MVAAERLRSVMAEALVLAERARMRVEPNPAVGAIVLDSGGAVVGRGHTAAYGGLHAEPAALREAGVAARGGTLVTTLEPCAHTRKKTPPCVRAIAAAGIAHVVAGVADPNPATAGQARAALAASGIGYHEGVCESEAAAAIADYAAHLRTDVPWTIAKWALSADGRTADARGASRWITGAPARALVHEIRARVEAVVVGVATVIADDPQLTARDAEASGLPPATRVVLDSALRVPPSARLVVSARAAPTIVICAAGAPGSRRAVLEDAGVVVIETDADADGRVDVLAGFRALRARGVRRALLEAGGTLTGAALRSGVVHQVMAFVAPLVIGGTSAPGPFAGDGWLIGAAPRLVHSRVSAVGDDALLEGYWPTGR